MDGGKIIAEGTPKELKEKYGGGQKIELELGSYNAKLIEELKKLSGAKKAVDENGIIVLYIDDVKAGIIHKISKFLADKNIEVWEIKSTESSLEDVFINLTKKKEEK